jgi:hypothetical protein
MAADGNERGGQGWLLMETKEGRQGWLLTETKGAARDMAADEMQRRAGKDGCDMDYENE